MEFISQADKDTIQRKLNDLIANRPALAQRIADARALGDLKENAEYHASREEQAMQEAEIRRLEERLASCRVADSIDRPDDMVFLGCVVTLKDLEDGSEDVYKIVGDPSGNFDSDEIEVTSSSPMGSALMKARVGDTVRVNLPRGVRRFEIRSIK
jgi:transcription elongation factor GreA